MLSKPSLMTCLAVAASLSLVQGCASSGSLTFPPRADLMVEPKPQLAPEAVFSEAALDAHDIAIEARGDRMAAQVARLCRFFDHMGMPDLDCPEPEPPRRLEPG